MIQEQLNARGFRNALHMSPELPHDDVEFGVKAQIYMFFTNELSSGIILMIFARLEEEWKFHSNCLQEYSRKNSNGWYA